MKTQNYLLAIMILVGSCTQSPEKVSEPVRIIFSDSLSIFAPGIISTAQKERDLAISPDGNRILFTKTALNSSFSVIMETIKNGTDWSKPEIAAFSGKYSDLEPAFAPDGKSLFFATNRPVSGNEAKDFDIWQVPFTADTWGIPVRLDTTINKKGNEFYPSVSKSGNLYFTASYDFESRKEDIYVAAWDGNSYLDPISLSDSVNTVYYEFNAFVDPDEKYIIYSSFGRPGSKGGGDLYISHKGASGNWGNALPLSVNTATLDYCPFVSSDGKHLFFTSNSNKIEKTYPKGIATDEFNKLLNSPENGNGDIWIIPFDEIISSN